VSISARVGWRPACQRPLRVQVGDERARHPAGAEVSRRPETIRRVDHQPQGVAAFAEGIRRGGAAGALMAGARTPAVSKSYVISMISLKQPPACGTLQIARLRVSVWEATLCAGAQVTGCTRGFCDGGEPLFGFRGARVERRCIDAASARPRRGPNVGRWHRCEVRDTGKAGGSARRAVPARAEERRKAPPLHGISQENPAKTSGRNPPKSSGGY